MPEVALVVTTIHPPSAAMRALADGAAKAGWRFIVIGDESGPSHFDLPQTEFYDLASQRSFAFRLAERCPTRSYARKNLGYLLAVAGRAEVIVETDDDNEPLPVFWLKRCLLREGASVDGRGWINVYSYYSDRLIWPRGLPLDAVKKPPPPLASSFKVTQPAPVQQALANGDPDVDAVFRLLFPSPTSFSNAGTILLLPGAWCPFNSQNTSWFRPCFPLLYLPSYCSFRLADIWRSLVALPIMWINGWCLSFDPPTVTQNRNAHDLMRDFELEVDGYLKNRQIADLLMALDLAPGEEALADNMRRCYETLVRAGILPKAELALLQLWLADLASLV